MIDEQQRRREAFAEERNAEQKKALEDLAADRAARLAGSETEANPTAVRYFLRTGTYSIAKARRLLGYDPQVDVAEGMARTERWLREQRLV